MSSDSELTKEQTAKCNAAANKYVENCKKFELVVDPSVVIALRTGWSVLKPSKSCGEGTLLPLMGILNDNEHITKINVEDVAMQDGRFRSAGNGNSNARALVDILKETTKIKELNLSNTGLDDDGIREISNAIKKNNTIESLNLSSNHFGTMGATYLSEALGINKSIKNVDLSRNALGFSSINALLCVCKPRNMYVITHGNYVFEEILNSVSHGLAFIGAVVGANLLITDAADTYRTETHFWACVLYSFSLMFLFMASCLFHSAFMSPTTMRVLQILDHVGIYMLIAGSMTPFMLIGLHKHTSARVLICAEWIAAVLGSMFAACADLNAPTTTMIELTFFVGMGSGFLFVWDLMAAEFSNAALTLLWAGNLCYLSGITFYLLGEYKPIYHTVWHLFVVAAATLHWFAVYWFIVGIDIVGPGDSFTDATGGLMGSADYSAGLSNVGNPLLSPTKAAVLDFVTAVNTMNLAAGLATQSVMQQLGNLTHAANQVAEIAASMKL